MHLAISRHAQKLFKRADHIEIDLNLAFHFISLQRKTPPLGRGEGFLLGRGATSGSPLTDGTPYIVSARDKAAQR